MSTQITIKSKSLFKKKIDFQQMMNELNLNYGAYDENYNLNIGKFYGRDQAILFNPNKIGMGIIFDGQKLNKGTVVLMIQPYATESEIDDVYAIVNFICKKYKSTNLYLNSEYITLGVLKELKSKIIDLSFENLQLSCKRTIDCITSLRLALTTLHIDDEFRDRFGYAKEFKEFENFIHLKQQVLL